MAEYDFTKIESKWQAYWAENGTFLTPNPGERGFDDSRPKFYVLDMFPYPSGKGLHVGHPEGYTATDITARYMRMKGYNVLHPMGYDAFGLPAEQFAVEHGVHPRDTTDKNIANIERQIRMFGFSYDWSRRVSTTDVDYYRWTQWIFLQLFNSWFDPRRDAARPISELEDALESGEYLVDLDGGLVAAGASEGMDAITGIEAPLRKWHELDTSQQRRLLDEYRLAYQSEAPVNWCPALGTVLANEEVTNEGRSERGDHPVYRRPLKQWMLRITAYAERLEEDLKILDWPEPVKLMQRNWIGRSQGAEVDFALDNEDYEDWLAQRAESGLPAAAEDNVIRVFTTRPDTLFGATYMVLAPEHPLVADLCTDQTRTAVQQYIDAAANKSELERTADTREKTGVFTGSYAINPVNGEKVPVWVADYVMMGYGTGAIMAVPAHDSRDLEFAEKFDLDIIQVVEAPAGQDWRGFTAEGKAVNSGIYNGLSTAEMKARITEDLNEKGLAKAAVNYKLRDWLFSRQRYWGEPFPVIHCEKCGTVGVPEEFLPVELPDMDDFSPASSDDPEAPPAPPLGKATDWANTTCPSCDGPAVRELNTMPQWAGSCWYYLRYLDPKNDKSFCDPKVEKYWMTNDGANGQSPCGIDLYVGGAEHAVLHLLYSRFWHKVLYDLGHVSTSEPFGKLFNQGMIRSFAYRDSRGAYIGYDDIDFRDDGAYHKESGEKLSESVEKMSKSLKNVVNPDEIIDQFGADTFRLYEMFMGPLESSKPWNTRDIPGVHRFCRRVWQMIAGTEERQSMVTDKSDETLEKLLHRTIKKVGADVEAMKFNTAISAMMEFVNEVYRKGEISKSQAERFVLVMAAFTPHLCEELWSILGHAKTLTYESFPAYEEAMTKDDTLELPVQINGKLRSKISIAADTDQQAILSAAKADEKITAAIEGKTIVKEIVIPGRLINIVVKG